MSVATAATSAPNLSTVPHPDRLYPLPIRRNPVKILPFSSFYPSPALFSQARWFVFTQRRAVPRRKASRWQTGVCALVIGSLIRWRQWQRLCRANENGVNVDLVQRVEKVEQDLQSSVTIVRVLSRQLEKLGIRLRVTRKALKEPISETAALAQKNSEATRALALQEDILERELGEIQKVLLAMQEQQQKQLELILAIGKTGRLLDGKRDSVSEKDGIGTSNSVPKKEEAKELEYQAERRGGNNDKA
ncbi:hypothetical protein COCNU_13G003250 [Cocos nucifera]|uniref:Uncharacterized protein n=1 Tax=Cocos nucifera TaxID=13894 RepID=A0A8K0ITA4_COCNU|nr:hypothetical protein COCNU_13G003250 [Cocos nucifera]